MVDNYIGRHTIYLSRQGSRQLKLELWMWTGRLMDGDLWVEMPLSEQTGMRVVERFVGRDATL